MARLRSSLLGLFVIGALVAVGCGDDPATTKPSKGSGSDDDDDDDTATSKKDAGKDAGKATDAGKKDAGAAVATVECGSKTCKGTAAMPPIPASMPCCFDEEEELCSAFPLTGGTVCPAPAVLNEDCPTVTILGSTPKACCTADNHCGIDATSFGMGCADLASPQLASIPGVTLPPAQTCDGVLLEPANPAPIDAGKPATGGDAGKADAGAATDAGKVDAGKVDAGKVDAGKTDAGR
jgi:hypothetical protein